MPESTRSTRPDDGYRVNPIHDMIIIVHSVERVKLMKPGAFENNRNASSTDFIVFGKNKTVLIVDTKTNTELSSLGGDMRHSRAVAHGDDHLRPNEQTNSSSE